MFKQFEHSLQESGGIFFFYSDDNYVVDPYEDALREEQILTVDGLVLNIVPKEAETSSSSTGSDDNEETNDREHQVQHVADEIEDKYETLTVEAMVRRNM